ncbi:hypothetical protein AAVH_13723 [Aphelenchoides avenae]|nr:hypothetical protein AAVH_13723 [Aphelenchus avenae]
MSTPEDTVSLICSFRPARDVKRVIFWFRSDHASLSHVDLVRLVTVLSSYYTTHYKTVMQYVVVSPSGNSRQDDWSYGILKYLVPAEVVVPDARSTMLPHDLLARDASERHAVDSEDFQSPSRRRVGEADSLVMIEGVKHYLRVQHELDLWSHYDEDHGSKVSPTKPSSCLAQSSTTPKMDVVAKPTLTISVPPTSPLVEVAADNATPSTQSAAKAEADNATAEAHASSSLRQTPPTRTPASRTPKPQPMPQLLTKLAATQGTETSSAADAHTIAAPAASTHRHRGHKGRRRRRRDHGPAPKAHGLDSTTGLSAPSLPPDKDRERHH